MHICSGRGESQTKARRKPLMLVAERMSDIHLVGLCFCKQLFRLLNSTPAILDAIRAVFQRELLSLLARFPSQQMMEITDSI